MMMNVNAEQNNAITKIDGFLTQNIIREFYLFGYAGTGKTTCAIELQKRNPEKYFIFLAYTGKACNVLRNKGAYNVCTLHSFFKQAQTVDLGIIDWAKKKIQLIESQEVDYNTITAINDDVIYWRFINYHFVFGNIPSLLIALRSCADKTSKAFNKTGGLLFLPVEATNFLGDTCLIIDECSMLSKSEWRADIDRFLEKNPLLKVIYVGDPAQLPPITNDEQKDGDHFCDLKKANYILTQIMRQGEGSNILSVASVIRETKLKKFNITNYEDKIFVRNSTKELGDKMPILFSRADIILAYSGKTVSAINLYMRNIFGRTSLLPEIGEPILITKNIKISLQNIETKINNGEIYNCVGDAVLIDRYFTHSTNKGDIPPHIFELANQPLVKKFFQENSGRDACIVIPIKISGIIVNLPVSAPCFYEKYKPTSAYWGAPQAMYGYCLTVHKAQGSEWDNIIIIDEAFYWGRIKDEDYNRWLYTAITRAAKNIAIFRRFQVAD